MPPVASDIFSPKRRSARPLILLLQGPVGPFFRELRRQFIARDYEVIKINFNGGDSFFSLRTRAMNFRGSPAIWSAWLETLVTQRRPAAIVLFGDSRPYHIEAIRVAADQRVPVWCLEEGYVRPDYITCEQNGNNARSPLRLDAAHRDETPVQAGPAVKNPFASMAVYAALYSIAQALLMKPFQGNARHRHRPLLTEFAQWLLNVWRKTAFYRANRRLLGHIETGRLCHYYVVALQVHDDLSLLRNGNGWTMERLIEETIRSFAYYAPPAHQLLFKVHPLDRGHRPYRTLVAKAAKMQACEARVRIIDDGPIGPMIRGSLGLITVNSTSGLIALRQGKPLLALGKAVYSSVKLRTLSDTGSTDLHAFWQQPAVARDQDIRNFFGRMHRESLINGSFYLASCRSATAEAVANRIQAELAAGGFAQLLAISRKPYRRIDGTEHASLAG